MPVTNWDVSTDTNGRTWLTIDLAQLRVCLDDPDSGVFIAVAAPIGGITNIPALVQGDPGFPATFTTPILHPLEYTDPTPDNLVCTLVTPATAFAGPVYRLELWWHKGPPGDDGDSPLDPADYGTPAYKRLLQVNSALTGFEYVPQKHGGMYWPTTLTEAPAGSTSSVTLAPVPIPALPFAYWPMPSGVTVVSASSPDFRANFAARLNSAGGPLVGLCPGLAGSVDRLVLPPGPDTGAAAGATQVPANTAATVYFRVEKQSGTATYQTGVIDVSRCCVIPVAVP